MCGRTVTLSSGVGARVHARVRHCDEQFERERQAPPQLVHHPRGSGSRPLGYRASLARLESQRASAASFTIFDWVTGGLEVLGFEPQYRILVSRTGTQHTVGVREARTPRRATSQLAEVDEVLAHLSESQAAAALGLDF